MMRVHGWSIARVGAVYGSILLVFSTSGILMGGWWVDRLAAKGFKDAVLKVAIAGSVLALPFAIGAPFSPTGEMAMAIIAVMSFAFGLAQGLPAAAFQVVAPNRVRARVIALYLRQHHRPTVGPTGVATSDYWLLIPPRSASHRMPSAFVAARCSHWCWCGCSWPRRPKPPLEGTLSRDSGGARVRVPESAVADQADARVAWRAAPHLPESSRSRSLVARNRAAPVRDDARQELQRGDVERAAPSRISREDARAARDRSAG
jgi:hypothetical protein